MKTGRTDDLLKRQKGVCRGTMRATQRLGVRGSRHQYAQRDPPFTSKAVGVPPYRDIAVGFDSVEILRFWRNMRRASDSADFRRY